MLLFYYLATAEIRQAKYGDRSATTATQEARKIRGEPFGRDDKFTKLAVATGDDFDAQWLRCYRQRPTYCVTFGIP